MMTILEALAIIEAAVLECKKRNINTSEVRHALDLSEPCMRPEWVMSQFRFNTLDGVASNEADGEAQEQALRATFPGIRDSVRELLGKRMDALVRKFHDTHDMKVKDEIERLAREYGKLKEPWVFSQNETGHISRQSARFSSRKPRMSHAIPWTTRNGIRKHITASTVSQTQPQGA